MVGLNFTDDWIDFRRVFQKVIMASFFFFFPSICGGEAERYVLVCSLFYGPEH